MHARSEKVNLFREAKWKHLRKHSLKLKKKNSAKKKKYPGKEHFNCHFSFMRVEAKFQLASYGCSLKQNNN